MTTEKQVELGFHPDGVSVPIDKILYLKQIDKKHRGSTKYRSIAASVREIGIIEPPVVYPQNKKAGTYLLLDGHLRIEALKETGAAEVFCLVSTDDESFTYNHKISRLSPIQEHFMIVRAVENGVAPERIAATLSVDIAKIRQMLNLLNDICPEAVELLKDKTIAPNALRVMKKVRAIRQIEMAELMASANNYTLPYANALYAATPADQLAQPDKPKEIAGIKAEDLARMEREMEKLKSDYRSHEELYGQNVLILVHSVGYLNKLLNNAKVVRFLSTNHPEMLQEIQKIVEAVSLEG